MDKALVSAVDGYIESLFLESDETLERTLRTSDGAGLPEIQISPAQGKLLYLLAKLVGAKRILEIGTLGGYSTIWLGRALPDGGELVTLEYEQLHAEVARSNLEHAGLGDRAQVVVGAALETLPGLEGGEPFDLVFIDADKENYPGYLKWAIKLTRPGGLILADNVVREGEVIDTESEDPFVQGVRMFNEMLAADPRAESVIIQLVGGKGYDGIALARRL
ncbi:MAG: O-methyltransferase [Phycisphaera sp.]|nr:MAG: O-methyltransferase [Phycisphaera sp.]